MKFIGALVLLGFMTVVIASLVQSFAVSVPEALMGVALQGLLGAIVISTVIVLIAYRAARWVRSVAGPNGRYAFGLLVLLWTGFMFVLGILPPEPSGAPAEALGGLALVGLFAGAFIFLGFIWSVITE